MVELARNSDGVTGRGIAEKQQLPAAYLEQILARLRNAKLVSSIRGAKGRFILAKDPNSITLAHIVEAVEGPIVIAECDGIPHCHSNPDCCVLRKVYLGANEALRGYLDGITLAGLAREQEAQERAGCYDYDI